MFVLQLAVSLLLLGVVNANLCLNVTCESSLEKCVGNATHASCICKDGYYRTNSSTCERRCDIHYCFNSGTCQQNPSGKICICVSPYHGSRCENENTISVQIAVGSSVMAAVLIIFLAIIIWRNKNEDAKTSEKTKKPWDYEEFQKSPDSFLFCGEVTNSDVPVTSRDIEATIDEQNSDLSSTRFEAEAQITPTGSVPSKEREEEFGISGAYVNVVAEENEKAEDKEEEHTNEKENVEESGKDSHGGPAGISNVYVNVGADTEDAEKQDSAL